MTLNGLLPSLASAPEAESKSLEFVLQQFDVDGQDKRKVDYLRHRYAGFTRKESGGLAGVTIHTVNQWLKQDSRMGDADLSMVTGLRKELRREVLQEEWYRNFYLVLQRDAYVLKKVHGLLEEPILEQTGRGMVRKTGSPPMQASDWKYYSEMRKMYTPESWAAIEKALSKQGNQFNIAELILNLGHNQQVNVTPQVNVNGSTHNPS